MDEPNIPQIQPQQPFNQRQQQQHQPPVQEKQKDWENYESTRTQSMIKTEYDQKIHLIEVDRSIDFHNLVSLVTKELDTSFINDQDLKIFYQINFENVLEWANMGLFDLAKIRLSKLFGELKLEKSVGGFERILQGSSLTGSVVAPLPSRKQLFPVEFLKRNEGPKTLAERIGEQS